MSPWSWIGFGPKERSPAAPSKVSTTKSEWLPDDPTAFARTKLWKLPSITTWDASRNQNHPIDSAEEAFLKQVADSAARLARNHLRWCYPNWALEMAILANRERELSISRWTSTPPRSPVALNRNSNLASQMGVVYRCKARSDYGRREIDPPDRRSGSHRYSPEMKLRSPDVWILASYE